MSPEVPVKKVEKEWGYELWLANNKNHDYCGKILHINKGHESSLHYHEKKHETMYVLKGKLEVMLVDTEMGVVGSVHTLREGEAIEIDRCVPHRLYAVEDVDIIESSTFHMDSDSKRKGVDWD